MLNYLDRFCFLSIALVLGANISIASPKNTLPPGFHSTPLEQPEIDQDEIEKTNTPTDVNPNSSSLNSSGNEIANDFLPLLEQELLLPSITGLLYGKAGLGETIWLESDDETLLKLLKDWQVNPQSRPAALLARRLLLTQAQTPSSMNRYEFLLARLEKLYALGDLKSIEQTFNLYPVLISRPEFVFIYRQLIFAKNAKGIKGVSAGCALMKASRFIETQTNPITKQMEALCLGFLGQTGKALSKAERLSDLNIAPQEFFPLLANLLRGSDTSTRQAIAAPQNINSLLWVLYKANNKNPRAISIKSIEPVLLPIMAVDNSLPHGWRLSITQAGILRALISPRKLQSFYANRRRNNNDWQPPLKFNRTLAQNNNQVQRISNIFSNAPTRVAYMASLYAWARDIAFLEPSKRFRRTDGLAASLLLNNEKSIKAWFGKAKKSQTPLAIRAMRAILNNAKRSVHRGVSPQAISRWQQNTDLLIKITSAEFFNQNVSGVPDTDDSDEGEAIIDAADDNKRTEVILRVLLGMDNPALARQPSFLRAAVRGLRQVGLKEEAWQIIIDSFLLESWGA